MNQPQASELNPTREDFAALLEESLGQSTLAEGSVIKGKVVAIEKDLAVIDVGLKTEGRVALKEFSLPGQESSRTVASPSRPSAVVWRCSIARAPCCG